MIARINVSDEALTGLDVVLDDVRSMLPNRRHRPPSSGPKTCTTGDISKTIGTAADSDDLARVYRFDLAQVPR